MAAGREGFLGDWQLAFGFPDYFGRNWDAFSDSIGDFEPLARLAIHLAGIR